MAGPRASANQVELSDTLRGLNHLQALYTPQTSRWGKGPLKTLRQFSSQDSYMLSSRFIERVSSSAQILKH